MSRQTVSRPALLRIGLRRAMRVARVLVSLCALSRVAAAQTAPPPLAKGARVRVVVPAGTGQPERTVSGGLIRLQGDTVVIRADRSGAPESIVLNGERPLEAGVMGRRHALEGTALGVGLGALVGAGIAVATWKPHECTGLVCLWPQDRKEAALYGAVIGVVPWAVLGLIVGIWTRDVRWVRVETTGIRIAVAPRGVGLGVAF